MTATSASSTTLPSAALARHRVVLLGASNLTRGLSTVIESAQQIWGQPLEVLSALGHGRSYGINSTFLGRTLPGILHCGLWDALQMQPSTPTAALITDVGNDLLYHAEVPQIIEWVDTAIGRLQRQGARVSMTLIPIERLIQVSPRRFYLFRTMSFPRCRLSFREAHDRTQQLHAQLQELGHARQVRVIQQRADWYGLDPIHIQQRHWQRAWGEILGSWQDGEVALPAARGSLRRWMYLFSRSPQQQWILGLSRRRTQPVARLHDGTSVSFF